MRVLFECGFNQFSYLVLQLHDSGLTSTRSKQIVHRSRINSNCTYGNLCTYRSHLFK
ncbi:hypothetical protein IMSAGC022_00204 [Alistipes sp.]|nr:hypothetical protein IMSAGC022_00204 [Alistipes sp.]